MAPTKPLVNQQIQACYQFMGVSKVCAAQALVHAKPAHALEEGLLILTQHPNVADVLTTL